MDWIPACAGMTNIWMGWIPACDQRKSLWGAGMTARWSANNV